MKTKFTTENGSVYVIDPEACTWEQIGSTDKSGKHRSRKGNLVHIPHLTLGYPAWLEDDDVQPGCSAHIVQTSHVVAIEEIA